MASRCFCTRALDFSRFLYQNRQNLVFQCYGRMLHKTVTEKKRFPHKTFPYPQIESAEDARVAALQLSEEGRRLLIQELSKLQEDKDSLQGHPSRPTTSQLWDVFLFNGVPFIAFGVLDNFIMIVAGEYIDFTLGAVLGISTMAAAALGNLISDVAGVGAGGYVESFASKIGVKTPDITLTQSQAWQTRWSVGMVCRVLSLVLISVSTTSIAIKGRAIGISLGCLIGMFPLLFFKADNEEEANDRKDQKDSKDEQATRE